MKSKAVNTLFLVGLLLIVTVSLSYGQEASSFPVMEEILGDDHEKSEFLQEDEDFKSQQRVFRDTLTSRSQGYKPKERPSDKHACAQQEEEALSFNFLYYIIQRVKMSDIMGE